MTNAIIAVASSPVTRQILVAAASAAATVIAKKLAEAAEKHKS